MQVSEIWRSFCIPLGYGTDNENPERREWLRFVGTLINSCPLPTVALPGAVVGNANISEARATLEGLEKLGFFFHKTILEENSRTTRDNIINLKPYILEWAKQIIAEAHQTLVLYVHIFCDLLREARVSWLAHKHYASIHDIIVVTHGFPFERTDWERFREKVSLQIEKANYYCPQVASSLEIVRRPSLLRKFK